MFHLGRREIAAMTILIASILTVISPVDSQTLQTFVLAVAGQSICGTFGTPTPVSDYFGPVGVSEPQGGFFTCGIDGGYDFVSSVTGPIQDDRALETTWSTHSFSSSTNVWTNYGHIAAAAYSAHNGGTSSLTVDGAEAFGTCEDVLTISSPGIANGSNGSLTLLITVAGHLATNGNGVADVEVRYQINGGPLLTVMRSIAQNNQGVPFLTSQTGAGLAGFALTPGALSGSGEVSSTSIPFVYGTGFVLKLGLLSYTIPSVDVATESDFSAIVTGIEVRGPSGGSVTDVSIGSASGTSYGPGGVATAATPLPASPWVLTAAPNPSRHEVELRSRLSIPEDARLEIYDVAGRRVRSLSARDRISDVALLWDGRDSRGMRLPNGSYFARMISHEGVSSTRMTLMR